MDRVLEAVHGDLAEHRGHGAVECAGEQVEPLGRAGRALEQPLEDDVSPKIEAVSASVSGVEKW